MASTRASRLPSFAHALLLVASIPTLVTAQGVGTEQAEIHPKLSWEKCTAPGACTVVNSEITIDANWRWAHNRTGYQNCYSGSYWDTKLCPTNKQCADNCALDGAGGYDRSYGITTKNNSITMRFTTYADFSSNYGSRVFLMADENRYQMFTLLGNEFTFDVDANALQCGINGALSFVAMDEDGGSARYPNNKAGAKYGTGYCDAKCPRSLKFIDGQANVEGWVPSATDEMNGEGRYGSCCPEVNVWDANAFSTALTIRPCKTITQHKCTNYECNGVGSFSSPRFGKTCDLDGCDFNPYRQGAHDFYGPGSKFTIDTTRKVTVVTQFVRGKGGELESVKRFYVQGGKVVANAMSTVPGVGGNQIDKKFCTTQKAVFGDENGFDNTGGMVQMGKALERPMVLSLSILDDHYAHMLWLDSTYPPDRDSSLPGVARGPCDTGSGEPAEVRSRRDRMDISNIRFGPINSTFPAV